MKGNFKNCEQATLPLKMQLIVKFGLSPFEIFQLNVAHPSIKFHQMP